MTDSKPTTDHPKKDEVIKALKSVKDPEIPVNVYDLGLIYNLVFGAEDSCQIVMTLTAPNCPMADVILQQVKQKVTAVEGIGDVDVELVWEPKWDPDMMSEAAKLELEFTGHVGPDHLRKQDKFSRLTVDRSAKGRKP